MVRDRVVQLARQLLALEQLHLVESRAAVSSPGSGSRRRARAGQQQEQRSPSDDVARLPSSRRTMAGTAEARMKAIPTTGVAPRAPPEQRVGQQQHARRSRRARPVLTAGDQRRDGVAEDVDAEQRATVTCSGCVRRHSSTHGRDGDDQGERPGPRHVLAQGSLEQSPPATSTPTSGQSRQTRAGGSGARGSAQNDRRALTHHEPTVEVRQTAAPSAERTSPRPGR